MKLVSSNAPADLLTRYVREADANLLNELRNTSHYPFSFTLRKASPRQQFISRRR